MSDQRDTLLAIAKELRDNSEALKSWFDSMVEQRKEAVFYGSYGIERAAKDSLDAVFRLAASIRHATEQTALAIEAITTGDTGKG
jgi:cell fate (sporulation/competence/biofilm development) regulator YmcA (YheA/YmcA/DUF963 family)